MIIEVKKLVLKKVTTSLYAMIQCDNDAKFTKFLFFIYFIATQKKKDHSRRKINSKKKHICKISIITIKSFGPIQQKNYVTFA